MPNACSKCQMLKMPNACSKCQMLKLTNAQNVKCSKCQMLKVSNAQAAKCPSGHTRCIYVCTCQCQCHKCVDAVDVWGVAFHWRVNHNRVVKGSRNKHADIYRRPGRAKRTTGNAKPFQIRLWHNSCLCCVLCCVVLFSFLFF